MTDIDTLLPTLSPDRPLLLLDADEVLLRFVERLEQHLLDIGAELRLTSFQLTGNIYWQDAVTPAPADDVRGMIASFFDNCVDDVPLIPGASDALDRLAKQYQIVILSNVPAHCRARREASLRENGLDYPVLSNKGDKGPAATRLAGAIQAQSIFVDDLPPQIASVAAHAPDMHLIHFVGDPRLAAMIGKAPDAHARFNEWPALETHLNTLLDR
ncbi:MAG: hypothetical protein HWE25_09735 [Alphaproteobacteria bacterium]|nr:hypothetical protein [Alphaproteobacteria bacterium]